MKTFVRLFIMSLFIINCQQASFAKNPEDLFGSVKKSHNRPGQERSFGLRQFFRATLYSNTGSVADGNVVAFDDMFNDGIDGDDALKLMNPGENFGIIRNAEILAIEARSPVQPGDTIFYDLQNLQQHDYQFRFTATNMGANGLTAYIVDRYLQTNTFIDLSVNSSVDFSITADAGTSASNRFYIIFSQGRMRELNFINLSATWNIDKAVELKWEVENERDVDHYTIERSSNGIDFTSIGTKNPVGNNGGTETYDTKDMSANRNGNYYRISAIDHYGKLKYSVIVNSGVLEDATVKIYPNPVKDKIMNIHFISQPAGKYKLQLSNKMGQVVYSGEVDVTGINQVKPVRLDNVNTTGTYQLVIISATGNKISQQVMIW